MQEIVEHSIPHFDDKSDNLKHPSGPKADQEKIFETVDRFLSNNIKRGNDEEVFAGFGNFDNLDDTEIENKLQTILNNWSQRGRSFYRNLISFHLLNLNYKKEFRNKFNNIVENKGKRSKMKKLAERFYIISKHCAKDNWTRCEIAHSYFIELNEDRWEELLKKHNIEYSSSRDCDEN